MSSGTWQSKSTRESAFRKSLTKHQIQRLYILSYDEHCQFSVINVWQYAHSISKQGDYQSLSAQGYFFARALTYTSLDKMIFLIQPLQRFSWHFLTGALYSRTLYYCLDDLKTPVGDKAPFIRLNSGNRPLKRQRQSQISIGKVRFFATKLGSQFCWGCALVKTLQNGNL